MAIYFTAVIALTVLLARTSLHPRYPRALLAVSFGALAFWPIMSLFFPGPLLPFLSTAGLQRSTTPTQATLMVLPLSLSVLAGGVLLTIAAPRQKQVRAAALALLLAALPILASVLAFPVSDSLASSYIASQRSSLQTAKAKWLEQGPTSYRYSFTFHCFCPRIAGYVFTSEVSDNQATISYEGSGFSRQPPDLAYARQFSTIDSILDVISEAIGESDYVEARYDSRTGFPTTFSWGTFEATDSIVTIEISEFEILP